MKNRANIATALILIAVGGWFLAIELFPPLKAFAYGSATWPIPILGIAGLLALVGTDRLGSGAADPGLHRGRDRRAAVLAECHRRMGLLGVCLGAHPWFCRHRLDPFWTHGPEARGAGRRGLGNF